jgi:hypothetical protein
MPSSASGLLDVAVSVASSLAAVGEIAHHQLQQRRLGNMSVVTPPPVIDILCLRTAAGCEPGFGPVSAHLRSLPTYCVSL